jgi:GH35 family endo-1,4-beta-xylanase
MVRHTPLVALILLSLLATGAQAALPAGIPVVSADKQAASLIGAARQTGASLQIVPVQAQAFDWCFRLAVQNTPRQAWDVQLRLGTTAPVDKGDVLLASFWLRCDHSLSGEAVTEFVFERAGKPYNKSAERLVSASGTWKQLFISFVADDHYEPGQANILFRLGYNVPQSFELAGLSVRNFKHRVALADLPSTPIDYVGHAPDAQWRQAAAERIERIRKGELTVSVVDAAGRPVPHAAVHVRQQRHAFAFGTAVAAGMILGQGEDADHYRQIVGSLFNRVVMENDLKWPEWENHPQRALDAIAWLQERHIAVRGHNLVWPNWQYLPRSLKALQADPTALRRRIDEHITEEATALRGKVVEWDVINEPVSNHDLQAILGDGEMAQWFQLAHRADPQARLFINDYSILSAGGADRAHQDSYERIITNLLAQGAPLQGIGLQSHFSAALTPPQRLLEILDRFARFHLPLEVTELDVDVPDPRIQADYLRDFMTVLFSHEAVHGIVMWGFWEGRHWRPNTALYRKDWSLKPNGRAWIDLVKKQWWTDITGTTDAHGQLTTRGFLGDYEITVEAQGHKTTDTLTLPRQGASLRVRFDPTPAD